MTRPSQKHWNWLNRLFIFTKIIITTLSKIVVVVVIVVVFVFVIAVV